MEMNLDYRGEQEDATECLAFLHQVRDVMTTMDIGVWDVADLVPIDSMIKKLEDAIDEADRYDSYIDDMAEARS